MSQLNSFMSIVLSWIGNEIVLRPMVLEFWPNFHFRCGLKQNEKTSVMKKEGIKERKKKRNERKMSI